jgi:hypothetical protein
VAPRAIASLTVEREVVGGVRAHAERHDIHRAGRGRERCRDSRASAATGGRDRAGERRAGLARSARASGPANAARSTLGATVIRVPRKTGVQDDRSTRRPIHDHVTVVWFGLDLVWFGLVWFSR